MTHKRDHAPGDGLRSVKTTNVFRAVNFELYTRPNKPVMCLGVSAIVGCLGYLAYMRLSVDTEQQLTVVLDDDSRASVGRKSKWDL